MRHATLAEILTKLTRHISQSTSSAWSHCFAYPRTGGMATNPSGLIGVWTVENTRDAIFDAIRKKEVFGTSGPRMKVRFYCGWQYDDSLCEAHDRRRSRTRDVERPRAAKATHLPSPRNLRPVRRCGFGVAPIHEQTGKMGLIIPIFHAQNDRGVRRRRTS
jgi:hypothetical protein